MRLDSLRIDQFRGIQNLTLEGFQDVNLLLGGNDIGKTSVLEAIMLFAMPDKLSELASAIILGTSRMRLTNRSMPHDAYTPFESFLHLFPFTDSSEFSDPSEKQFSVQAQIEGKWHSLSVRGELVYMFRPPVSEAEERRNAEESEITVFEGEIDLNGSIQKIEVPEHVSLRVTGKRNSHKNVEYLAPGQHLNGISNRGVFRHKAWEQETVSLLHIIDPDIEGIKLVPSEYSRAIYNQVLEHRRYGEIPLYTFGDGMKKILSLASILPDAKDGVLMIDEIETSLQASNLSKIFDWLLIACQRLHIQLFVTTHSLEAISVLANCALKNKDSELACYRLEKYDSRITARRYSEQILDDLVNGSGLDVR